MTRSTFRHVLLTRFNTRRTGSLPVPDEAWFRDRWELFERYCLPSVARQTCTAFDWLVFFDAGTPARWRDRLAGTPGLRPVFLDEPFGAGGAAAAIRAAGLDDAAYLITSRLDNDDALAPHFVETVQRAFRPRPLEFLNLPLGYQLAAGRVYLRPCLASSFASLVEQVTDGPLRTVHCTEHHLIGRHPVRQLWSPPAWLQVVHGTNLANEVRGIPVSGAAAARTFGLDGLDPHVPPVAERTVAVARFAARGLSTPDARARAASVLRRRGATAPVPPGRPARPVPLVTAILTCHDRRELTLRALAGWFAQRDHGAELAAVLVDDGSTDGTADAVAADFPQVTVIPGSGSLYWAAGMALAERHARTDDPDALVWLNDDVVLAEGCLRELMSTSAGSTPPAVVAGALADPDTGAVSYGAFAPQRWHPLRGSLVEPAGRPLPVRAIHGNVVYVPAAAYDRLGIDGGFAHAYADFDYGLRLNRAGHPVLLTPGTVGWCSRSTSSRASSTGTGSLRDRLARLNSPRGVPLRSQARYLRRHGGPLWPVLAVAPYAKEILRIGTGHRSRPNLRRTPSPTGSASSSPR